MSLPVTQIPAGMANKDATSDSGTSVRTDLLSPLGALQKLIDKPYERDFIGGITQWRAIVLRVEPRTPRASEAPPGGQAVQMAPAAGASTAYNFLTVRALIPELNTLPLPRTFPDASGKHPRGRGSVDSNIINLYPTFTSEASYTDTPPRPGDIVWVKFPKSQSMTNGIFIKKVVDGAVPPTITTGAIRKFQKRCKFCADGPTGEENGIKTWDMLARQAKIRPVTLDVGDLAGALPVGKGVFTGPNTPTKGKFGFNGSKKLRDKYNVSWLYFHGVNVPNGSRFEKESVKSTSGKGRRESDVDRWIKKTHQLGIRTYMMVRSPHLFQFRNINQVSQVDPDVLEQIIAQYIATIIARISGSARLGPLGIVVEMNSHGNGKAKPKKNKKNKSRSLENILGFDRAKKLIASFWEKLYDAAKRYGLSIGIVLAEFGFPDISDPSNPKPAESGVSEIASIPWTMLATGYKKADFVIHKFSGKPALYGTSDDYHTLDETHVRYQPLYNQAQILKTLGFNYIIPALSSGLPLSVDPRKIGEISSIDLRDMTTQIFAPDVYGPSTSPVRLSSNGDAATQEWDGGATAASFGPYSTDGKGNKSNLLYSKLTKIKSPEHRGAVLKELGNMVIRYEILNSLDSSKKISEADKNFIQTHGVENYLQDIVKQYQRFIQRGMIDTTKKGTKKYEQERKGAKRGVGLDNIFQPPGSREGWGTTEDELERIRKLDKKTIIDAGEWDIPIPYAAKSDGTGFWTARELYVPTVGFYDTSTEEEWNYEWEYWQSRPPWTPPAREIREVIEAKKEEVAQVNIDSILEICNKYAGSSTATGEI